MRDNMTLLSDRMSVAVGGMVLRVFSQINCSSLIPSFMLIFAAY